MAKKQKVVASSIDPYVYKWKLYTVNVKFEKRDLWIGVFWDIEKAMYEQGRLETLMVYVCIIPTLPVIFTVKKHVIGKHKRKKQNGKKNH